MSELDEADETLAAAEAALKQMYDAARELIGGRVEAAGAGVIVASGSLLEPITPEEWAAIVAEHLGDVIGDAVLDGAVAAAIQVGGVAADEAIAAAVAGRQAALAAYGPTLASNITVWLRARTGQTTDDVIRALAEHSPVDRGKAAFVARTEITAAQNAGLLAGYRQGGVAAKRWVTRRDLKVRDAHAHLDGVVVPADGDFNVDGWPAAYPGDWRLPIGLRASCRCTIAPVDGPVVRETIAATKAGLVQVARDLGVPGRSTMNKGALQAAILTRLCMQGLAGGPDCPNRFEQQNMAALLATARAAGIRGRYRMRRRDLIDALNVKLRGTDEWRTANGYATTARWRSAQRVAAATRARTPIDGYELTNREVLRAELFRAYGGVQHGSIPCVHCGLNLGLDRRTGPLIFPAPARKDEPGSILTVPACAGCFVRSRG